MTYATAQDLVDRYGEAELIQLTGRAGEDFGAVVTARADLALAAAAREIDAYLRPRYAVPVAAAEAGVLADAACALARVHLMLAGAHTPTDPAKEAADRARAWLRDLAEGKAMLDLAPASSGDAPATGRVEVGPRVLSREDLSGW